MVCTPCHKALGGGLSVNATGEFRVPTAAEVFDHMDGPETANAPAKPHASNVCAWCGKLEPQVKKLLGRGGIALCNECISLASDIMEAELGAEWK